MHFTFLNKIQLFQWSYCQDTVKSCADRATYQEKMSDYIQNLPVITQMFLIRWILNLVLTWVNNIHFGVTFSLKYRNLYLGRRWNVKHGHENVTVFIQWDFADYLKHRWDGWNGVLCCDMHKAYTEQSNCTPIIMEPDANIAFKLMLLFL